MMRGIVPSLVIFFLVACTSANDSSTSVEAVYLVQGEGQLTQEDLQSHPEILVTNDFDDFKKLTEGRVAIWIDMNSAGLVDIEWLKEKHKKYYPVVLVGDGDELCSFMVTLWYVELEGPGGYECDPPPPGFSVNVRTSDTGGKWHGYKETPTVEAILGVTNPLLQGIQ